MKLLLALWIVVLSFSLEAANPTSTKSVDTIADLRAILVGNTHDTINVRGYLTVNDGGQGTFEYDPASVAVGDNGINFQPNVGSGMWTRVVHGRDYIARWWGPTRTNATLQAAINWVSANGYGSVTCDGGTWTVKSDDSTRITMKSGVTLRTAEDSQIVCSPNPSDNWVLIDFALDSRDWTVGPARLVGWNLAAPGGDTNKAGVIFSAQDTHNGTIGGIRASNWYTQYADIGSGNENLQMFDQDWQLGAMSFGAYGDGITDDRKNLQAYAYFCERYNREFYLRPTTNGYLIRGQWPTAGGVYFTNGIAVKIRGDKTIVKNAYYNPDEGIVPRYSSAFNITADNCTVEGFDFRTTGAYPITETNISVTGFFIPLIVHMATNTQIRNCTFDVENGKGIFLSGTRYTTIENCFFERCGLSTGNAHQPDWLWYEVSVPFKLGPSRSPIGLTLRNNTFNRGTPYKHTVLLSAPNEFVVDNNHWVDMNTLTGPLIVYSGDEGTTDENGTNVYLISGKITKNTFFGTNFGTDAALWIRLNTETNFVPASFNPSNVTSGIIVEGNIIRGGGATGRGIELLSAPGTRLVNNDVRTGGNPIWRVGNANDIKVYGGGWYEATNVSTGLVTFHTTDGYLQPGQVRRTLWDGVTLVSPPGDECMFRNIEPAYVDSITVRHCNLVGNMAAGYGDYPQLYQWTMSTNFVEFSDNTIYIGPSMSGRRLGLMINTNADMIFHGNRTVTSSSAVMKRGAYFKGRRATVLNNDVGSIELEGVIRGQVHNNYMTSETNTFVAFEVHSSGFVSAMGNTIENLHTNNISLVVAMGATNSTFGRNIVIGHSSSDIVRNDEGKMYEGDNIIINLDPAGFNYATTNAPAQMAHSQFERSAFIEGNATGKAFSVHRTAGGGQLGMYIDGTFTGSSRDVQYYSEPDNTNDLAGHAFYVHKAGGTNQFLFGLHGQTPPVIYLGDSTNAVDIVVGGVSTNTMLYVDNNHLLKQLTIGTTNLVFTNGTLYFYP